MDKAKKERLEAAGFKVGTVAEFLGLMLEEEELIETRLALSRLLREFRNRQQMQQKEVAQKAKTSQSRIAKAERIGKEGSDSESVSIELMLRALYAMGATRKDVADALASL